MMSTVVSEPKYHEVLEKYPKSREHLIPILQDMQEFEGFLSRDGIFAVADYLGLPESKIYGVATFYNQFKLSQPGKYQILICRGTACHVKGSLNLLETLSTELGIESGETTKDGLFTLDEVACVGACSIAPVITINGEFYGRLTKKKLIKLLEELKAKEQNDA